MNRRTFLGVLASVPLAPLVPPLPLAASTVPADFIGGWRGGGKSAALRFHGAPLLARPDVPLNTIYFVSPRFAVLTNIGVPQEIGESPDRST